MEERNIPAGLPTCPKASASQLLQVQPDFPDSPTTCAIFLYHPWVLGISLESLGCFKGFHFPMELLDIIQSHA